jgi:hypothetical protein
MPDKTLRFTRGLGAAILLQAACAVSAHALTIKAADVPAGVSSATVKGVAFESAPRAFQHKSNLGFTGLGIRGGYVDGEIDLDGESITIRFGEPTVLSDLVLGHLFKNGNFGDTVSEVARVEVLDTPGKFLAGDLSVITGTTATWSAADGGAVTNLSPGLDDHGGLWSIANPFGNLAVKTLKLYAVQVGGKKDASNSDFSFGSLTGGVQPVPEPGTALLLGAGIIGLAAAGRARDGSTGRAPGRA